MGVSRVARLGLVLAVVGAVTGGLGAGASSAAAQPAARFGWTVALADEGAPLHNQFGPLLGVGVPLGPLLAEVDYAFLSFVEPDTVTDGMHRFGVNLRADLYRTERACTVRVGCTRAYGVFAQLGAAVRYGQWALDARTRSPAAADRQREAHVGLGLELDNRLSPSRLGWQFALRLAMAPRDDLLTVCRGVSCGPAGPPPKTGELDMALLIEWVFIIGR